MRLQLPLPSLRPKLCPLKLLLRRLQRRRRYGAYSVSVYAFLTFPQVEEKKEKDAKDVKALKVSRRISARVTDFFKIKKVEVNTPAKVDENPPVIDQPAPLPPLENPATDAPAAAAATEPLAVNDTSEPAPVATPVIAAAA